MISEELRKYKTDLKKMQTRILKYMKPEQLNAQKLRQAEILLGTPPVLSEKVSWKEFKVSDKIPCEWVSFSGALSEKVIYYIHGGSYYAGSAVQSRGFLGYCIENLRVNGLSIDYRLAPEFPFPLGLEDCIEVYQWLITSKNVKSQDIIIIGSSAGGGLALATIIKLRELGSPLPRMTILLCPWLDLSLSGKSIKAKAVYDGVLNEMFLEVSSKWYCGEKDPKDPLLSPLFADLAGLPPFFVQVGSHDILMDDSVRFSEKARAAGVEVKLDLWEEMPHGFMGLNINVKEVKEARAHMTDFILERW